MTQIMAELSLMLILLAKINATLEKI